MIKSPAVPNGVISGVGYDAAGANVGFTIDAATSPDNRPGCCGTAGFSANNVNCANSIDDDMFVYIRLTQPGATAATCNEYTLTYHF